MAEAQAPANGNAGDFCYHEAVSRKPHVLHRGEISREVNQVPHCRHSRRVAGNQSNVVVAVFDLVIGR
jgi:hypothetical protein